jgi:hypothetical protein
VISFLVACLLSVLTLGVMIRHLASCLCPNVADSLSKTNVWTCDRISQQTFVGSFEYESQHHQNFCAMVSLLLGVPLKRKKKTKKFNMQPKLALS